MGNPSTSSDFDLVGHFGEFTASMRGGFPFLGPGLADGEAVLMATAMIDKTLQFVLTVGFYKGSVSKALMERVFEGQGPLATFSAKIDLARVQGLTDDEQHHDLRILRKVRNDFAHTYVPLRLADRASCDNLKLRSNLPIKRDTRRAENFLHSSATLVGTLMVSAVSVMAKHQVVRENRDRYTAISTEMLAQIFDNPANILNDALSPSRPDPE